MAKTPWQQRIRRAEHLAGKHPFAAEILGFYIHTARFQEGLYQRLEHSSAGVSPVAEWASRLLPGQQDAAPSNPLNLPEVLRDFPSFLGVVEQSGTALLAQIACSLKSAPESAWSDLLNACWFSTGEPPSDPDEFLALSFLQPYAEYLADQMGYRGAKNVEALVASRERIAKSRLAVFDSPQAQLPRLNCPDDKPGVRL